MAIPIIDNFRLYTNKPIDTRMVVSDSTERDALNTNYRYDGMMVYLSGSNKFYMLEDGTSNDNWSELRLIPTGSFTGSFTGSYLGTITTSSITNWGTEVSRSAAFYGFGATSGSGGGETNDGANLGNGQQIYKDKNGVYIRLRTLTTGSTELSMSISLNDEIVTHLVRVDGGTF